MNKDECKLMKFNVCDLPLDTDIVTHFKELSSYKEFTDYKDKDKNLVLRYIFLCYDFKTPLLKTHPELKKRKEEAMDLAGFERNSKGKFSEKLINVMDMKDEGVNKIILCFLTRIQNNMAWTLFVANEFTFSDNMRLLMKPLEGDDDKKVLDGANARSKLREECKAVIKDQEELLKSLFADNNDLKELVKKKIISPETV